MPTFKLEDMDENQPYGGDNDMYFRQWRLPSMKPVLDEKLDRDFLEAVAKKDEAMRKRAERRQKHSEKYDKKFQEMVKAMSEASVKEKRGEFSRKPIEEELKRAREDLEREFASPSSTARMVPFKASIRPRQNPIFGEKMVLMKDLVLPPPTSLGSAPRESTFGAHETVFYPQTHDSFNLDHYNGSRPSFAFSGIQGATSTPVSAKGGNFFNGGIPEELEDSVFESSKYVTAMESPIQKAAGGQKTMWETPKTGEGQKTTSLGIQKAPEVSTTSVEAPKLSGLFQKSVETQKASEAPTTSMETRKPLAGKAATSPIFASQTAPGTSIFGQKSSPEAPNPNSDAPTLPEPPKTDAASSKPPSQPFILFKNYINLLKTLQDEKKTFETSSDPQFRSLLKRTITEKVTVFTERQTSSEARSEILEFFKTMLQKKPVEGFAVIGKAPEIRLEKDEEVNYAVHCVVEKYISLAELDEELAPTISDLISRLSAVIRRVEKVFIVLMFNKSTLLRQNPKECLQKFVEHVTAENSDEKAIEWNQEQALSTLFFTVFAKNALISTKGRKMVLSDELLWKYVETSIAHVLEVPKASFILLQLITICKPRLFADEDRWIDMLATIESEILPELEADPFAGDEAAISQLAQMVAHLLE
ncbi:Protein CBG22546 [Caenorhabditis briggsae]|uniref:Protein CBG22546 n=1 Tax=Caenorhabditis briggsae TaxID=6238 RepID=A8Y2I9_CAEBR|nr:Protein CBG22546 [Caenorhabditis briggsae]CAP39111.2 Protein CBG22546 [Caenorhabditis briggsae]